MSTDTSPVESSSQQAVEFDPMSTTYFEDPYDVYRRLRDEAPVYHNADYGFYALSRYDDVVRAHRDWKRLTSTYGVEFFGLLEKQQIPLELQSIISMDPPMHNRLRALVSNVFSVRAIAELEPMVEDVLTEIIDPLTGRDEFDVVEEFSALFPVEVVSRVLGVPDGERQAVRHRLDRALSRVEGQQGLSDENIGAFAESYGYFNDLTAKRRNDPQDDMISALISETVEREDGTTTALTDHEIAAFAALLGAAGAETVIKLMGNAAVLMGRHQQTWQRVVDDRTLVPSAVEEVLRYYPPSQYQGRFSTDYIEFDGGTIPAGHPVLLITGAATRDERHFDRPDDFNIDREASVSLAFGHGVHLCLGAALARLEAHVALNLLADRFPAFEVDESRARRVQMSNVAGYSSLPMIPRKG